MKKLFIYSFYLFSIALVFPVSCDTETTILNSRNNFQAEDSFYYGALRQQQTRLRLNAITGAIQISGSVLSDSIIINATKRVKSSSVSDAEEGLLNLDVSVQNLGNEFVVSTELPLQTQNRSYEIDYTIQLPSSLVLQVSAVTGGVTITTMDDTVTVIHTTGSVGLNDVTGNSYVELVTGGIECVAVLATNGTIDLKTVTGNIDLTIPGNTSASFSAGITTGSITLVNILLSDRVETARSVTGIMGTGDGNIQLQTTTGNIRVTGL